MTGLVLTIRTDNPTAEIGLYENGVRRAYREWHAHRELSATIHHTIEELLSVEQKTLTDLTGIVCFAGPGSFTGLRIGIAVANAFAAGLGVPIVAAKGDDWISEGLEALNEGPATPIALPFYGMDAIVTTPRK